MNSSSCMCLLAQFSYLGREEREYCTIPPWSSSLLFVVLPFGARTWFQGFTFGETWTLPDKLSLGLYFIPFYDWIIFYCMDITFSVVSTWNIACSRAVHKYSYILWLLLLWIYTGFLLEYMFSILLAIYLGIQLLDHLVTYMFKTFWEIANLLLKAAVHFTCPPIAKILTSICCCLFLLLLLHTVMGMKW